MRSRETKALAAVLVLGAACGAGCGSDETSCSDAVISRADPGGNFAKYATFAVPPADAYPDSLPVDVTTALLQANTSAAAELTKNGFQQVSPSENPDLSLFSLARTADQNALYWQCTGGYWYGYWGWYWDSCAYLNQVSTSIPVGTVVVGLVDPALQKIVYGGAVQGVLSCGEDQASRVDAGVTTIMSNYPYYF